MAYVCIIVDQLKRENDLTDDTGLSAGDIVSLQRAPENVHDPHAVKAIVGDKFIGYLANSEKTIPPGCKSATTTSDLLARPDCAGANARLISPMWCVVKSEETDGETIKFFQRRWIAEVFYRPAWDKEKSGKEEPMTLKVGGNRVMNSDMATVMLNFSTYQPGDLVAKLSQRMDGGLLVSIWRANALNDRNGAPAGEVQDPPEKLLLALQTTPVLPVVPDKILANSTYQVSIKVSSSNMEEFYPDMDELMIKCIMQSKELKKRVHYLLSQNVPAKIIHGVLAFIQRQDADVKIKPPRQLYLQTMENDCLTRALGYHLSRMNIRLVGEKGSGKNTLVSSVCWVLNQPLCRIQGNADMDKIDLLGSQSLNEHGTTFTLSTFVKTLQSGGDVVLDEINAVKPEIAIILHSLADDARSIEVPGYGFVEVSPRSCIWATMNENYVGTGELNSATADRFVPLFLDEQMDLKRLLKEMFPEASEESLTTCDTLYHKIVQAVHDGGVTSDAITTRGFIDAMEASKWIPLRTALLDNVANRPQDKDDRRVITDYILASFSA